MRPGLRLRGPETTRRRGAGTDSTSLSRFARNRAPASRPAPATRLTSACTSAGVRIGISAFLDGAFSPPLLDLATIAGLIANQILILLRVVFGAGDYLSRFT